MQQGAVSKSKNAVHLGWRHSGTARGEQSGDDTIIMIGDPTKQQLHCIELRYTYLPFRFNGQE